MYPFNLSIMPTYLHTHINRDTISVLRILYTQTQSKRSHLTLYTAFLTNHRTLLTLYLAHLTYYWFHVTLYMALLTKYKSLLTGFWTSNAVATGTQIKYCVLCYRAHWMVYLWLFL